MAAASAALVAVAPTASADATESSGPITVLGTCGQTFAPSTSGAKAYWEVQCSSGRVRISGWVEDTASDGQCAKVKAIWPNGNTYFSPAACPKGNRKSFTSQYNSGNSVNAYLYEYDV
ncbi:hypothetical protein A4R43_02845 [Amycolatopsis albispora]|uniref:Uncharacterized protein n=1 Tax=Amycolatopsis albispora TaxID=1804986 RepID=A0A344L0L6_9PSEU|nr:hypothetical protein A4R43_02845 [Amycolatopsis albispora]